MSFFSVKPRTKEEKELDKRLQHFYEERAVYTPEPTVFDNFEEPHVEREEDVPHASVEIEDGHHEVHHEDYDGEEHDIIPHDQSISQEYLDQLVAKTIDHEAERIRELATAKEQIIDFMKEMHELSLKQEEERHKRRLEQDKERLLLYREYTSAMFESMVGSSTSITKQDVPGAIPSGVGQQFVPTHHKSEQSDSRDRKKRKVYPDDFVGRHPTKPRTRVKPRESDKENSFDIRK